jgi:hypothetical protein
MIIELGKVTKETKNNQFPYTSDSTFNGPLG